MADSNNESRLRRTRELIAALHDLDSEVIVPSEGEPFVESRDPHLRLRRTLTPPSPFQGCSPEEAQFMISGSTGHRISLSFSCLGDYDFTCDGYFFGAREEEATKRIFAVHGLTPGISRTRWHALGERLAKADPGVRFCAIDWHSIDRTEKFQEEFLTCLPKHFFDTIDDEELFNEMVSGLPADKVAKQKALLDSINSQCPRDGKQGAQVLRAMIEQGCGWGKPGKPFSLCIKSWSGAIGMQMLVDAKEEGGEFRDNIAGAVIMHPAFFSQTGVVKETLTDWIPVIMSWARDDPKVAYRLFAQQYIDAGAKIVGPQSGGHANFLEFDDDAKEFLLGLSHM